MSDDPPAQKLTVRQFANATVPGLIWWAVIPSIFIVLKHSGVELAPVATSASIVERLSTFWFALTDHFQQVQKVASGVDTNNLGFFYVAVLLFAAVGALRTVMLYVRQRETVQQDDWDPAVGVFLLILTIAFSALDRVWEKPDLIFNFYVDEFGFYYFRETLCPYLVCFTLAQAAIVIADTIKESRTENSSA